MLLGGYPQPLRELLPSCVSPSAPAAGHPVLPGSTRPQSSSCFGVLGLGDAPATRPRVRRGLGLPSAAHGQGLCAERRWQGASSTHMKLRGGTPKRARARPQLGGIHLRPPGRIPSKAAPGKWTPPAKPRLSSIIHGTKYRYRAPREVSAELFCLQTESLGPGERERVMEGTK